MGRNNCRWTYFRRNPGLSPSCRIASPAFGKKKLGRYRRSRQTVAHRQLNIDLAVGVFSHRAAILLSHTNRMPPLFDPACFINDPALDWFQVANDLPANDAP